MCTRWPVRSFKPGINIYFILSYFALFCFVLFLKQHTKIVWMFHLAFNLCWVSKTIWTGWTNEHQLVTDSETSTCGQCWRRAKMADVNPTLGHSLSIICSSSRSGPGPTPKFVISCLLATLFFVIDNLLDLFVIYVFTTWTVDWGGNQSP